MIGRLIDFASGRLCAGDRSTPPTDSILGGAEWPRSGLLQDVSGGVHCHLSTDGRASFHSQRKKRRKLQSERSASSDVSSQVLADLQAQLDSAQATYGASAHGLRLKTPKEVADARTEFQPGQCTVSGGPGHNCCGSRGAATLSPGEIDDSLAKLAVWRALLQIQIAQGDISSFLAQASR